MNISEVRFVIEVARSGSICSAAEKLSMAQPNLSRAIRELEKELGVKLFKRSYKGMALTPQGEQFVMRGEKIIREYEDFETSFKGTGRMQKHFSISVPRASYISYAFTNFSRNFSTDDLEVIYKETNSWETIENVVSGSYKLGIVRYEADYEDIYRQAYENKGLAHELVASFRYVAILSKDSPIAKKKTIRFSDLNNLIQITHGDPYIPVSSAIPGTDRSYLPYETRRNIYLFERGSQFDLLRDNPETFMWVSPIPKELLDSHHLLQLECLDSTKEYRDALIYRKDYHLSDLDDVFLKELTRSKKEVLGLEK